ncbi:MAG: hypothetical protein JWP82_101, partial [Humibacillus sp.]|nr:hypothetical protein [Humibacillus sp.]
TAPPLLPQAPIPAPAPAAAARPVFVVDLFDHTDLQVELAA